MFCCLGPWLASYRGHHQVVEIINEKERSKNDGGSSLDLVSAILNRGKKKLFSCQMEEYDNKINYKF
jgi:hypothetical protein